ncbi:unnamed protein product [Caenorhabditis sp. 36 PRJEB53466]|nr:unnamed protein product [Caenorhabditis sp. 36 PRJEB53466]
MSLSHSLITFSSLLLVGSFSATAQPTPIECTPNETVTDGFFTYKCVKNEAALVLEPISCEDHGKVMNVGESVKKVNGSVIVDCNQYDGDLKLVAEYVPGCYHNGTVYRVGENWEEMNAHGDESNVEWLEMECKLENGYYENRVSGCITEQFVEEDQGEQGMELEQNELVLTIEMSSNGRRLKVKRLTRIVVKLGDFLFDAKSETYRKCAQLEPGYVGFLEAEYKRPKCTLENRETREEADEWIDAKKGTKMVCQGGEAVKKGCLIGDYELGLYEKRILSDSKCVFLCHPLTNVYACEEPLEKFSHKFAGPNDVLEKLAGSKPLF